MMENNQVLIIGETYTILDLVDDLRALIPDNVMSVRKCIECTYSINIGTDGNLRYTCLKPHVGNIDSLLNHPNLSCSGYIKLKPVEIE